MPGASGAVAQGSDGPAMSSQLKAELQGFRSALLKDMRCLLQGALQEVLDKHQVLVSQHEENLQTMLSGQNLSSQASLRPTASNNARAKEPRLSPVFEEATAARRMPPSFEDASRSENSKGLSKEPPETPASAPKRVSTTSIVTIDKSVDFQEFSTKNTAVSYASALTRRVKARDLLRTGSTDFNSINTYSSARGADIFAKTAHMLKGNTDPAEIPYDVTIFYKPEGCITNFVQSSIFNSTTLFVILVNALYLGLDADINDAEHMADADIFFQVCEHSFCAFFTCELTLRFAAFERKCNCLRDPWFVFDFALVLLMIVETWLIPVMIEAVGSKSGFSTGPLGLLRLLRLARVTRFLRSLPELVTMVKGIVVAMRAMFSALVLLLCLIYVFGILLHSLLKDQSQMGMYFATLPRTMWTLFLNGVFLDSVSGVVRLFIASGESFPLAIFVIFAAISACTVMNMLIGVLCEVVSEVATAEHDNAARNKIRNTILVMLRRLDKDGSGDISKRELIGILEDPAALAVLDELKVNLKYFLDLQDMLYETPQSVLSISTILTCLMESRGDRQLTMSDLVIGMQMTHYKFMAELYAQEERLAKQLFSMGAQRIDKGQNVQDSQERNPNAVDRVRYWMYTNGLVDSYS